MDQDFLNMINFPYSSVRKGQDEFIKLVYKTIGQNKNVMVQAPTGLGKTVSGLAPALYYAKQKGLTVICLTSRQTQANQVIKTIAEIQEKSGKKINYVAFIGKRSMCVHEERDLHPAQDFNDFCKKVRMTGRCGFYKNAKNDEYAEVRKKILEQSASESLGVEGFVDLASLSKPEGSKCGFCPYELAGEKAFQADVVICDYNYLFQQGIRESFLGKIGRTLEECVVVVDEAHNLPDRVRNAHSYSLSTQMIDFALKEMADFVKTSKHDGLLFGLKEALENLYRSKKQFDKQDYLITKELVLKEYLKCAQKNDIDAIIEKFQEIEMLVKEDRIVSHIGRVANFLQKWVDLDEDSFLRVLEVSSKNSKTQLSIKIRCIDPSGFSGEVLNKSYSSVLMSGTLSPITMYKDILGIENVNTLELESPFAHENQLTFAVDDVTTKFSARSVDMFKKIASHVEKLLHAGSDRNALVFFPSYDLMEKCIAHVNLVGLRRKVLREQRYMTKEKKEEMVKEFKSSGFNDKAKVLFAITSGSFAEGLDLPRKALEMVIVVGLPLGVPDQYTQAVIQHFDKKFKKGQLYGYIYPAMSKIIQAAGRCIRTEEDRGIVALLDNRFMWPLYAQTFPNHWKLKRLKEYKLEVGNFFDQ